MVYAVSMLCSVYMVCVYEMWCFCHMHCFYGMCCFHRICYHYQFTINKHHTVCVVRICQLLWRHTVLQWSYNIELVYKANHGQYKPCFYQTYQAQPYNGVYLKNWTKSKFYVVFCISYEKTCVTMAAILNFAVKRIPQGWQGGIIRILILDMLKYHKHQ